MKTSGVGGGMVASVPFALALSSSNLDNFGDSKSKIHLNDYIELISSVVGLVKLSRWLLGLGSASRLCSNAFF